MSLEVITSEDLEVFRIRLLEDIKKIILPADQIKKEWLKSAEIRKLLKISPGTLQNLRVSGKLRPVKIGGTFYYRYDDIQRLLEGKENT
jgi:hypothetical protein